jgi:integrase
VRDILRTQIISNFGVYQFEAVQPLTIEKWKQQRQKKVEKATVKKELDVFSNVFRIARKIFRYTRYNPREDIERPTVPKKKPRVPSAVEIQRFFETAGHHRPDYFAPLLTMYITGACIDEVRHLEPGDVLPSENKLAYHVKDGWSPNNFCSRS